MSTNNQPYEESEVRENLYVTSKLEIKPNNAEKIKEVVTSAADRSAKDSVEIDAILREMPLTDDVSCGFWIFKGAFLQRFATQTGYVILYGIVGLILSMTYAYFNGTITTIEKRYKIPSKNTGIISIGNNISQMIVSAMLSYYAGKGHRPRWIGFGVMTFVLFCVLNAAPHFLYGPGETALSLTREFGAIADENATLEAVEKQRAKSLCRQRDHSNACVVDEEGNWAPQAVLFVAQIASGVGGALYYTLGVAYMDDNTKKSNTPALLSYSYFFHMLGPAIGYALASFCLRVYIAPALHPVINNSDPRWMGAWWMGWLLLGAALFVAGIFFAMLPKELPRAVARRLLAERRVQEAKALKGTTFNDDNPTEEPQASLKDMLSTFKRLITNKVLMYNHISSVFYLFGYMPFWIFTPKYIETQYRQSAATSSMVTGTVALAFSAIGVLLSGVIISKCKPRARYLAAWNVVVGVLTVVGVIAYAFIGCPGNEQSVIVNIPESGLNDTSATCNSACGCDYVPYSPVCGENKMTYISPCHAGCKHEAKDANGKKIYLDCGCVPNQNATQLTTTESPTYAKLSMELPTALKDNGNPTTGTNATTFAATTTWSSTILPMSTATYANFEAALADIDASVGGYAQPGACPVNCFTQFVTFLAVMCLLKFVGATGRASNFLVSVRCVPPKDKTASMGFGMMLVCMLAFIPSPIFFGWLFDRLCLVWGKSCTHQGNCWLYNPESLRYTMNFTSAFFIAIGTLFDGGVWYYVKDLKIFDDEVHEAEMEVVEKEEEEIMLQAKV